MRHAILGLTLLFATPAFAHSPNAPEHQLQPLGDLKLESGEAIKDFLDNVTDRGRKLH